MSEQLTMSVEEAAQRLDVTEDWLRRKASAGVVPSLKIGRSRRFTEDGLQAYLESCRFVAADSLAQSTRSRSQRRRAS